MSPEDFIQKARNNSEITGLIVRESKDTYWDYYYQFVGFLNGKYFGLVLVSRNGNEKRLISSETEDVENFKKYFNL